MADSPTVGSAAPSMRGAERVALIGIVVWGALLRLPGLLGPFGDGWQWLGAFYGMQARNLLRYGFAATAGAGVTNPDLAPSSAWIYYLHHPPGTLWSMAGSFALFGESAFASKLPAYLFALAQIAVTWRFVRGALSPRAGLAAALLTATLPAGAHFTSHGSELGPAVVCLAVAALALEERARRRSPEAPPVGAVVAALIAATLFSWAALSLPLLFALRDARARRWRRAATLAALPPLLLAAQVVHVRIATGQFGGGQEGSLLDAFLQSSWPGFRSLLVDFGPAWVARRVGGFLVTLFTWPGLALAAWGALLLVRRRRIAALRDAAVGWPALGAATLVAGYSLPFPESTVWHVYWLLTGLPLVALLVAVVLHAAVGRSRIVAAVAVLAVAVVGTKRTLHVQAELATPWFGEAGAALRELVPAGTTVWTPEPASACLKFHSGRELHGSTGDAAVAELLVESGRPAPLPAIAFLLVQPPAAEAVPAHDRIADYLRRHYPVVERALPASGRLLLLYDLARPFADGGGG